jgi:hypothetical protein
MTHDRGFLKLAFDPELLRVNIELDTEKYGDDSKTLQPGDHVVIYNISNIPVREDFPLQTVYEGFVEEGHESTGVYILRTKLKGKRPLDFLKLAVEKRLAVVTRGLK